MLISSSYPEIFLITYKSLSAPMLYADFNKDSQLILDEMNDLNLINIADGIIYPIPFNKLPLNFREQLGDIK